MIETVWAILQKDNKFLLAQRSFADTCGGTWTFPGGRVDHTDETPKDAARRELKEEVGLTGRRFRKLGDTTFDKYHIQFLVCNQWTGIPRPSCNDIINVDWFSWTEMYSINLAPFVDSSLMYLAYLIQHYDHFPEAWKEVEESG